MSVVGGDATPNELRNVIEGIRTAKSTYETKSNLATDSPYRPMQSNNTNSTSSSSSSSSSFTTSSTAVGSPTTQNYHQSTPSSLSSPTLPVSSSPIAAAAAVSLPPATPSTNDEPLRARAKASSSSSNKQHSPLGFIQHLQTLYERTFLEHSELFAQIENIATSTLFLMPGSMRDTFAEFGS